MEHYFTNNESLKSEIRNINFVINNVPFSFASDNGVFSKDKIDFGSKSLISTILKQVKNHNLNILDVGCGYGFIGITISKLLESHVDMVDVNKRAIHLAQLNIKNNKVDADAFLSDAYSSINKKYDLIITNPPIRAGKEVVNKILLDSFEYLNDTGELWFVMRKDQGAKSAIKLLEESVKVELVEKNKGFYCIKAKRN